MLLWCLVAVVIVLCRPYLEKCHAAGLMGLNQSKKSNCLSVLGCFFKRISYILFEDTTLSCWISRVTEVFWCYLKSNVYQFCPPTGENAEGL